MIKRNSVYKSSCIIDIHRIRAAHIFPTIYITIELISKPRWQSVKTFDCEEQKKPHKTSHKLNLFGAFWDSGHAYGRTSVFSYPQYWYRQVCWAYSSSWMMGNLRRLCTKALGFGASTVKRTEIVPCSVRRVSKIIHQI